MRLGDLSEFLATRGLALSVLGTSSAQTIAGAIATATHGSGVRHGNLLTQVRAVELVTANGDVASITERQNADLLHAARTSLGLLRVVTPGLAWLLGAALWRMSRPCGSTEGVRH